MSRGLRTLSARFGAWIVLVLLGGLFGVFRLTSHPPETTPVSPSEGSPGWYGVYFTDPPGSLATGRSAGPDTELVAAMDRAQTSIDVASYELNLWSIRDALEEAQRRGVRVRVIVDSDNVLEPEIQALESSGIPVLGDRRESLMHHKFAVLDGEEIWTGSMNLSLSDGYYNDNNLVRIQSRLLAQNYTREFDEMFLDDRFGDASRKDTPYPGLDLEDTHVENLFSPDDGVADRILQLLAQARSSIEFMAFAFTSDDLAGAMIDRSRAGVGVRGVFEASQVAGGASQYAMLREAGLDVRLDGNEGNLHHKVILLDGETVITGSYNFSRSAEVRNDENVLILHSVEVARAFRAEFDRVMDLAVP
jgi:phosphatidylserine/phosphatidylglycerophosphate/cardiolipin synthase-like enzyme